MEAKVQPLANTHPAVAILQGQAILELPQDLYIPPEALHIFLETFEGPLDLLLYLIKKQKVDILNIPIATITSQYMEYVEIMREINLELAADYLVMAAFLAEIKSRLLLPTLQDPDHPEEDPRAELVRKLQEYERFKKAAEEIEALPRVDRDIFVAKVDLSKVTVKAPPPQVELKDLLNALAGILQRIKHNASHQITREPLSIKERMTQILGKLKSNKFEQFSHFFSLEEGRLGVVVTFIAILELIRQSLIEIVQVEPYAPIHIRAMS